MYNKQPSTTFTSFAEVNGKSEQAPVAAVIETAAEKEGDDDGEVCAEYFTDKKELSMYLSKLHL